MTAPLAHGVDRAVLEASPVAQVLLGTGAEPLAANAAAHDLLGVDPARPDALAALPIGHDERVVDAVRRLVEGRSGRESVDRCVGGPGDATRCGRLTLTPVRTSDGVVAVLGTLEDLSERRAQELELRHAHRRLEAMLANISDTVTLVDEHGVVVDTTGTRTSVMGYPADFWRDRSIFDLVDDADLPRLLAAREFVLRAPGRPVTIDVRVQQSDGRWADIELTAVNLLDDPSLGGIVITSRNITDRKRTESELAARRDAAVEQSRLHTEFVARVSHELRNQVHALRGLTELLSSSDVPRPVQRLVGTAHRQAEQFGHLVDDLLEYAHLESDRMEPDPGPVLIRQLVADALLVGQEQAHPGVRVTGRTDEQVPDGVVVDGPRVRQVLANLVGNAAKFTRRGRIELVADRVADPSGDRLRFRVTDTGTGIEAADLDRIFQPFERAVGTGSPGAGLGLAISSRIARLLGGTLTAASSPGAGSTFTLEVPLAEAAGDVDTGPGAPAAPLRPRAHVLVVEDNPVNQLLVAEQLARLGVEATVVGDAADGLAVLDGDHDVDCVLMDWQLPGMDGVEATRVQRSREGAGPHVPIIGLTASGRPSDRAACLAAGMDELLIKPIGLTELAEGLRPYVGERRARDRSLPAPTADTSALDTLAEQLGAPGPVRSVVATFLRELDRREAAVAESLAGGDADGFRRTLHTLRATSRTLGAVELDELSQRLERAPFPPPREEVEAFHLATASARTLLEGWLASRDTSGSAVGAP